MAPNSVAPALLSPDALAAADDSPGPVDEHLTRLAGGTPALPQPAAGDGCAERLEMNEARPETMMHRDCDWPFRPPQPPLMKGWSWGPLLFWLGTAIALWLCAEIEQTVNPIPAIAPWFWLIRLGAILFVLGIAAGLTGSRGRPVCAVVVALGLLGPAARAAWPHRLRERETVIADAIAVLRERGLLDRGFYSTSDWSYYFAGRWYPARRPPLYEELRCAPAGSILVWEQRYGPSPDFNLQLDALRADPRWREVYRRPADSAGAPFVVVFGRAAVSAGNAATISSIARAASASSGVSALFST
jgi:hypothetical protein